MRRFNLVPLVISDIGDLIEAVQRVLGCAATAYGLAWIENNCSLNLYSVL